MLGEGAGWISDDCVECFVPIAYNHKLADIILKDYFYFKANGEDKKRYILISMGLSKTKGGDLRTAMEKLRVSNENGLPACEVWEKTGEEWLRYLTRPGPGRAPEPQRAGGNSPGGYEALQTEFNGTSYFSEAFEILVGFGRQKRLLWLSKHEPSMVPLFCEHVVILSESPFLLPLLGDPMLLAKYLRRASKDQGIISNLQEASQVGNAYVALKDVLAR